MTGSSYRSGSSHLDDVTAGCTSREILGVANIPAHGGRYTGGDSSGFGGEVWALSAVRGSTCSVCNSVPIGMNVIHMLLILRKACGT